MPQLKRFLALGIRLIVISGLFTIGCGSAPQSAPSAKHDDVLRREPERLIFPSPIGPLSLTVTAEGDSELPAKPDPAWLKALLGGAALVPLGVVAPPLFASALVVGGVLIFTGSAAGYGTEQMRFNAVARALKQSDFPIALRNALWARLGPAKAHDEPVGRALVDIKGWGVISASGTSTDTHCFVAAVELSVNQDDMQVVKEGLQMTLVDRSKDAPPLQCASLWKFAQDNGRLVRETARDYAEVFAVMVVNRLNKLR